jgi:hypothetical protein
MPLTRNGSLNLPGGMPPPGMDAREAGLWRGAAADRLDVQKCARCEEHRSPPSDGCPNCGCLDWSWDTLPGTGVVMTYVWIPDPTRTAGDFASPNYNVAVVELDGANGGPARIVTNIIDAWQPHDLQVGQRVELACVAVSEGVALPCFRRAQES